MPSPALLLLIATLLPLAGFGLLLFVGKRFGSPLAGWVGSALAVGSFGCTLAAMVNWYTGARGAETWGFALRPIVRTLPWLATEGEARRGILEIGIYIDSLTVAMFAMVTLVSAIIHLFSIGFLRREEDVSRLFAWLGLGSFAMLGMVLSGTLLQLLAFWGLIGFSTCLLVAFGWDTAAGSRAGMQTFIMNRIGDCALLIGFGLLFSKVGNASLPFLWTTLGDASAGHAIVLADGSSLSVAFMTLAGLCLFCGAAARCAQFPLQLWLPGASPAPIPGVTMVAAVTTAAAGVYLVARLFPILTPSARLWIAIIGLTTLTMAALISLAQRDLPRLLAWTAVCQFGYMVLAMGVGSWVGGMFHLITHAFIMATLFLAAGSIILANGGEPNMLKLAGGWRQLPVTATAFAVGALAMAGTPFLSKYYSQAMVLTDAAALAAYATGAGGRASAYWLFFVLPTVTAYLIAFSMARCWMLTFHRRTIDAPAAARLRERPVLWVPVLALAIPAIVGGYAMNVPELLHGSIFETSAYCEELAARSSITGRNHFTAFDQAWPAAQPLTAVPGPPVFIDITAPVSSTSADALDHGYAMQRRWVSWAWLIGIVPAVAIYWRGEALASRVVRRRPWRWIHAWLDNEMYFPELYEWTVVKLVLGLSAAWAALDSLWNP